MAMKLSVNRGLLFKNTGPKAKETSPDYSGKINISGTDYYLDGWMEEGPKVKYISLRIGNAIVRNVAEPVTTTVAAPVVTTSNVPPQTTPNCGYDDDIPF
jgi:hypothetical protein